MNNFIEGFKEGQKSFGEKLGVIINSILLSITYFLGNGLTSIVAKLSGKHFLEKEINKSTKTYWSDLNLSKRSMEEYYRQF